MAAIMLSCSTRRHEERFSGVESPPRLFNLLHGTPKQQAVNGYTWTLKTWIVSVLSTSTHVVSTLPMPD
jgi:hypothetical protein